MRSTLWWIILLYVATFPATSAADEAKGVWTEPLTGMTFIRIPEGCYTQGSDTSNPNYPLLDYDPPHPDEVPAHKICLDAFWMGRYEVSQQEWKQIMGSNPSHSQNDRFPVEMISWENAQQFVRRLTEMSPGKSKFRLPSEAEWEYACRSGGKDETYAGTTHKEEFSEWAWGNANSGFHSHEVGTLKPNGLNLFDMSGNVSEWVQDSYQEQAYGKHRLHNPVIDLPQENRRVIRGGSFRGFSPSLLCSDRNWNRQQDVIPVIGFRVVRSVK